MKRKFRIIIVLCPSESRTLDNKYAYYDLEKDKQEKNTQIYLGGDVRMQAAVQIASQTEFLIVVGGSKPKVDDMKNFLVQEFEKIKISNIPDIIRIESDPDTLGNLWAIKKSGIKLNDGVGILTNFYHLPRSIRISNEVFPRIAFIPLAAESLLNMKQSTFPLFKKEFILRISREINGLSDIENGTYKNLRDKTDKKDWEYKCYDLEFLKKLKGAV